MSIRLSLAALLAGLSLSACGGGGHGEAVAADALPVEAAADGALKPNERLQGTIELDIGTGPVIYQSIATKVPDNLGEVTAKRLGSGDGQRALDDANDRLDGKVQASDIQALADAFAGKTMYTSQMRDIDIIQRRNVTIAGTSADGRSAQLTLSFTRADNRLESAILEYTPDRKNLMQSFTSKNAGAVNVSVDRFEQVAEDTWAIAGTFKAEALAPGVLAKKLAGQRIDGPSGRFDIAELRVGARM